MAISETDVLQGYILRIVNSEFAYVLVTDTKRVLELTLSSLASYRGETFDELELYDGSPITLRMGANGRIEQVKPVSSPAVRNNDGSRGLDLPRPDVQQKGAAADQKVLLPETAPDLRIKAPRALNPRLRAFGKLVDCSRLRPGDLLLSWDLQPDQISKLIIKVQRDGGYSEMDSRWSHAAMYLGDGANVVEATFDGLFSPGSVRITSLDEYCLGNYALRFRRSKHVTGVEIGWRLCVQALGRLKQPYSFSHAARLWWDVMIRGTGFYDRENEWPTSKAVICSTLYCDAHTEATGRKLGEIGGVCVPAWLSVSDDFEDVATGWAQLS